MGIFLKTLFFLMLYAVLLCGGETAFAEQKKVLVIQSYDLSLEWTRQNDTGIRTVLGSQYDVQSFFMDTKRIPQKEFQGRAEEAWAIFEHFQPDLVMLGDDNALMLLGPRFAETNTPVVFFGINNNPRLYFDYLPENMTGVLERLLIFPWIRHLGRVVPEAEKALVLMDESSTTDSVIGVTFGSRTMVQVEDVEASYFVTSDWAQWQDMVKSAGAYSMVIIPTFHTLHDERGNHVSVETVVTWTSANCPVPVFSHQDYAVGDDGVVGSYVVYGISHGGQAGAIALQILEGEKTVDQISPEMDSQGGFYFNLVQLERFSLKLPHDIRVRTIFK